MAALSDTWRHGSTAWPTLVADVRAPAVPWLERRLVPSSQRHPAVELDFQIFALDTIVTLEAGAGRSALLEAMRGHVVTWGELVGRYERT